MREETKGSRILDHTSMFKSQVKKREGDRRQLVTGLNIQARALGIRKREIRDSQALDYTSIPCLSFRYKKEVDKR